MEFVTTSRGARALVYEGNIYNINRRGRDGRIFWRCAKNRSCGGSITSLDGTILSTRVDKHNHPSNEAEMISIKSIDKMKISVKETVDPIPSIYQKNMVEISTQANRDIVAAHLPTFPSIKSVLYRIRRERVPPLPKYRSEVHFEGEWTRTHKGEQFLLIENGNENDRMVIFTTSDNLRYLSNADIIYMDGTFQTCPSLFYQIFTLHAFKNGKQFPFVYCLLPGKSRLLICVHWRFSYSRLER